MKARGGETSLPSSLRLVHHRLYAHFGLAGVYKDGSIPRHRSLVSAPESAPSRVEWCTSAPPRTPTDLTIHSRSSISQATESGHAPHSPIDGVPLVRDGVLDRLARVPLCGLHPLYRLRDPVQPGRVPRTDQPVCLGPHRNGAQHRPQRRRRRMVPLSSLFPLPSSH